MIKEKFWHVSKNRKVRYLHKGTGRPIIFVTGWLGTAENFIPILKLMPDNFSSFVFELPGFGKSDLLPNCFYTVSSYAEILQSFIKAKGLKKPILMGSSLGGSIVLELAATTQNLVPKIIVHSPVYRPLPLNVASKIYFYSLFTIPTITQMFLQITKGKNFRRFFYYFGNFNVKSLSYEEICSYGLKNIYLCNVEAIYKSIRDTLTLDLTKKIPKIKSEVLVIYGENEDIFALGYLDQLLRDMPNCEFKAIPEGTHFLPVQKPQVMTDLIINFVNE